MIHSKLQKTESGEWIASFTTNHEYPKEQAWEVLTSEDFVSKWHPQLRMHELRDGGNVIFDFGNGEIHKLAIREFIEGKIFGFDWYGSYIRFEVNDDGQLLMTITINEVNEQTLRDLTGWTMVSKAINATLYGENFTFDKEEAGKIHKQYERAMNSD